MTKRLSVETYNKAQNVLSKSDPDLKKIIDRFGKPPLWHRPGGYRTLVLLILERRFLSCLPVLHSPGCRALPEN